MSALDVDLELWCDETLPEIYDNAMFDCEEIAEDVWESVTTAMEPLLDAFDDEDERDAFATQMTEIAAEWFRVHHALQIDLIEFVPATVVPSRLHAAISRPVRRTSTYSMAARLTVIAPSCWPQALL